MRFGTARADNAMYCMPRLTRRSSGTPQKRGAPQLYVRSFLLQGGESYKGSGLPPA